MVALTFGAIDQPPRPPRRPRTNLRIGDVPAAFWTWTRYAATSRGAIRVAFATRTCPSSPESTASVVPGRRAQIQVVEEDHVRFGIREVLDDLPIEVGAHRSGRCDEVV